MKKINKRICVLLGILAMLILLPCLQAAAQSVESSAPGTAASDTADILKEQKKQSGAEDLEGKAPESAKKGLNSLGVHSGDTNSLAKFTPANMLGAVWESLKTAVSAPFKAALAVLAILLACALLNTLKNTVGDQSLQNVFNIVSSLCIATVILIPVSQCVAGCAKAIGDSSNFMLAFLPVYSTLASLSGHPASAIASQSLLLVSSEALTSITSTTFVPMVDMYLGFCVVGAVSPGINISGISGFIKSAVSWALGLSLTIYTGILTVQGVIANAADTVTVKAAKFVVDNSVPVVGGAISDALNTVISCTGLLKTTVGAYAIVVFILAFLPPLLECLLWLLAADLSLAVADILGIENMSGMLKSVKEALKLLIALVLVSALAMIISVSVMLLLGNGN